MTAVDRDWFLGVAELAAILALSPRTLHGWRKTGEGPPHYDIGNRVWYCWREVPAWADACRVRRAPAAG